MVWVIPQEEKQDEFGRAIELGWGVVEDKPFFTLEHIDDDFGAQIPDGKLVYHYHYRILFKTRTKAYIIAIGTDWTSIKEYWEFVDTNLLSSARTLFSLDQRALERLLIYNKLPNREYFFNDENERQNNVQNYGNLKIEDYKISPQEEDDWYQFVFHKIKSITELQDDYENALNLYLIEEEVCIVIIKRHCKIILISVIFKRLSAAFFPFI
jgi:hypothetical protein